MGCVRILIRLTVTIGVLIGLSMLPPFRKHTDRLLRLLQTCPLHWFTTTTNSPDGRTIIRTSSDDDVMFTKTELALYNGGDDSKGLFVAHLGRVYDVSNARQFYAPGGPYSFFAGRDGTKAFVTGDFTETGLVDDVTGISPQQILEQLRWVEFYEKTYPYIGKLIGNFYNDDGSATAALLAAQQVVNEALDNKQSQPDFNQIFPPCGQYLDGKGGLYGHCTYNSGGVKRFWDGVPRLYYDRFLQKKRCVCVRSSGPPSDDSLPNHDNGDLGHPSLNEFEGCNPLANMCKKENRAISKTDL